MKGEHMKSLNGVRAPRTAGRGWFACVVCTGVLTVCAETLTWTGAAGDGLWNTTSVNWKDESDNPTAWVQGSAAIMTISASGTISLDENITISNSFSVAASSTEIGLHTENGSTLTLVGDPFAVSTQKATSQGLYFYLDVSAAGVIVKRGAPPLGFRGKKADLWGGLTVYEGQVRCNVPIDTHGRDIVMENNSNFIVEANDITITNRIVVKHGSDVYLNGLSSFNPVFTRLSTKGGDADVIRIGRTSDSGWSATLTLADDSDPIGYFSIFNKGTLGVNGGLLKMSPASARVFYGGHTGSYTDPYPVKIGADGLKIDSNGAPALRLGWPIVINGGLFVTNVVERENEPGVCGFPNGSVEENTSGWTMETGTSTQGQGSLRAAMDTTWFGPANSAYWTPYGSYAIRTRAGNTLKTTVRIPEDGDWSFVFGLGCRDGNSGHSSTITVHLDMGTDHEQTHVFAPRSAQYPFEDVMTAPMTLAAGEHAFAITVQRSATDSQWAGLNFDGFRIAKVVVAPNAPIEKTGDGTLILDSNFPAAVSVVKVTDGELQVDDIDLNAQELQIAAGGRFALGGGNVISNTPITVAGTLALSNLGAENLVPNGNFESPTRTSGWGLNDESFTGWTWEKIGGTSMKSGYFCSENTLPGGSSKVFPDPTCAAMMRQSTKLKRTITVPSAGTYRLEFLHGARSGYDAMALAVEIVQNGVTRRIATYPADPSLRSLNFDQRVESVELESGTCELVFWSDPEGVVDKSTGGPLNFIDRVVLRKEMSAVPVVASRVDFTQGATIDLDLHGGAKLHIEDVYVDGVKINGGRAMLQAAGVTVTGTGSILVGRPVGTQVMVR